MVNNFKYCNIRIGMGNFQNSDQKTVRSLEADRTAMERTNKKPEEVVMELTDLQKEFENITAKKSTQTRNSEITMTIKRIKDHLNHLEYLIKYPEEVNNVR